MLRLNTFAYLSGISPLRKPMMINLALDLFGNLIITFLGIFTPLLVIIMNISKEGIRALERTHNSTKTVMEVELKAVTAQQVTVDTQIMKQYINRIDRTIKDHQTNLRLLQPKRQFTRTFCTLMASFLFLEIYLGLGDRYLTLFSGANFAVCLPTVIFLFVSIAFFVAALVIIWQILNMLIKVRAAINEIDYDRFSTPTPTNPSQLRHG